MSLGYEQLDLFDNLLLTTIMEQKEPILSPSEDNLSQTQEQNEKVIEVEPDFGKGETVRYKTDECVYLHPYSKDGRTSAIRLGKSYTVVLTSALEKI